MSSILYKYLAYLLFPAIALLLSWIFSMICIKLLPILGFVDVPGGRHIHKEKTPTGGGIAIAIAFFCIWWLILISPWNYFMGSMNAKLFPKVIIPTLLILILGIVDDRFNLRARYKLFFQTIIAASCWYLGIRLDDVFGFGMGNTLSFVVTVFWILGFINAFNLIDGMDGLAAGLAVIASICMASVLTLQHAPLDTVVVICLGATCLGFLRYNFFPAKIFLGDTGSMFIGFMFAIIGIISSAKAATFSSVLIPLLAAGVPFFDVFLAIWRRTSRKILMSLRSESDTNGIMDADNEHIHHRIIEEHNDHRKAVFVIYSIAGLFAILAVLMQFMKNKAQGMTFVLLLIISVTVIRRVAILEMWNSAKAISEGLHSPKRGVVVSMLHPFYDMMILILSFILTYFLLSEYGIGDVITKHYIELIYYISPIVIILHLGRVYQRFWMHACSKDYLILVELIIAGNLISSFIDYHINGLENIKRFCSFHVFFFFISVSAILAERMFLRYLKSSIISKNLYMKRHRVKNIPKVLIYGGGECCLFYLTNHQNRIDEEPLSVIGIIDDNPVLWRQYIYGYKVLGGSQILAETHGKYKFNKLVMACEIGNGDKKREIVEFCRARGVTLSEFKFSEVVFAM